MTTIDTTAPLDFLGTPARILVSGDETGGAFALVDMLEVEPNSWSPLHVHHNEDEGFYVLDGEVTLHFPDHKATLGPGEFSLGRKGVPHTYCAGPAGARWLVTSTPAGFERFVVQVAALEAVGPQTLAEVATEHGIEILGPPGMLP